MKEINLDHVVTLSKYAELSGKTIEEVENQVSSGFLASVPIEQSRFVILTAKEAKKWL